MLPIVAQFGQQPISPYFELHFQNHPIHPAPIQRNRECATGAPLYDCPTDEWIVNEWKNQLISDGTVHEFFNYTRQSLLLSIGMCYNNIDRGIDIGERQQISSYID